ncbi:2'-5' RNA ligase family protein [Pedobacter punctiformis]|uniref:2'-5' RNA ligase family protein n=1 Tax=Pedobacter punctiformis TaxID=3004097 RepID=A0ABT4LAB1_9SPHI|nr:2'-5' RNA ligase family protein [Pedobacter sp. HCMS5-2]MCZ4244850.1 2'-5' RNA ligase family protein [Pedobacter sp. HCMS5-2]
MENLFLVCIIPPVSIVEDIDLIRNDISAKYNVHESLKRPAHITLYNPVKLSSALQEQKFFDALERACFMNTFEQVLKNFSAFAPHTIYIDVEKNDEIMKLQGQIKKELKPLALLPEKNNFKFTPHLTIAFKDVKPETFESIMNEYQEKQFKRTFTINNFSVYKYMDKRWRPYKEFQFKHIENKPKPLSLFD